MKKCFLLVLLLPLFSIAQTKSKTKPKAKTTVAAKPVDGFIINAIITGYPDGTVVDLINNQNGAQIASTTIQQNKFVLKGKMDFPDFRLITFNKQPQPYIVLFLDNSDVKISGTKDALNAASVTGSVSNSEFIELNRSLAPYQSLFSEQEVPYDSAAVANATQIAENFAVQHPKSYITPLAIIRYNQIAEDDKHTAELYNALSPQIKTSSLGMYLGQQVSQAAQNGQGTQLTDFSEPDTAGNIFNTTSLRGKYVLIDFWASWCGPCRRENPNVVAAYNKFKDKNFTVLGVSLDKAKPAWIEAINMDNLTWTHVSDLQGWQNAVAVQFGINQIPQNILIDPQGKIIAKNLRGDKLNRKLSKLLQ